MTRFILLAIVLACGGFILEPVRADLGTYLELEKKKAPRGLESIPNHPRACAEGDLCFHNADADATFYDWAKALAKDEPDVTAEDIIHFSGWGPYINDKALLMDKMFYAYSTGPTSEQRDSKQARVDEQESESRAPQSHEGQDEKSWWQFWKD